MVDVIAVSIFAVTMIVILACAFRVLPGERWQMAAALPIEKDALGRWRSTNLTFYGVLTANAYVAGAAMLLTLFGAIGIPHASALLLLAIVLSICVPASRIIATIVERQKHTFTVAGAMFTGVIMAPAAIWIVNLVGERFGMPPMPTLPVLAAMAISYALGEGLGRLACISFGCCYGKPIDGCKSSTRRWLAPFGFVFRGNTKKAAYESGFDGVPLIPVQAIAASLLVAVSVVGLTLYRCEAFRSALIFTIVATQSWRFVSEFLRADYRGDRRISTYQKMAVVAMVYTIAVSSMVANAATPHVDLIAGLASLWSPVVILSLQALWITLLLFTGRSEVTESLVSFYVRHGAIARRSATEPR